MEERRKSVEPRRAADRHVCPLHDLIQDETQTHRKIVCDKIAAKADQGEVRGLSKLIAVLVTICCLVVAGQAIWLKSDMANVATSMQRLNIRMTEATTDRQRSDTDQALKLESISGQLVVINWRLGQLEDSHKIQDKK